MAPSQCSQKQHKEELKPRRVLDAHDRSLINAVIEKYPHPLGDNRPYLYNPVSGQIASIEVNVTDSIAIRMKMESDYIASLPEGFYNTVSSPIKTMCVVKGKVRENKSKPVMDIENNSFGYWWLVSDDS